MHTKFSKLTQAQLIDELIVFVSTSDLTDGEVNSIAGARGYDLRANLENFYMKTNVPPVEIQALYLGKYHEADIDPALEEIDDHNDALYECYCNGLVILNFLYEKNYDSHPLDKSMLLIYTEQMCKRYNLRSHKTTGFGHDIVYSTTPLAYTKFDNDLYLPPSEGYWAIVSRGGARD